MTAWGSCAAPEIIMVKSMEQSSFGVMCQKAGERRQRSPCPLQHWHVVSAFSMNG
ncbi:hypothetical protein D9M72_177460 [compost metagenome]